MEPEPGTPAARCPACGSTDAAGARLPLFVVTGASGSGKTAIFAPLARMLAGCCVSFDVDWLLDAAGDLAAGRPVNWPAFRSAWLAIAHGAAQSGLAAVLLGPLIPAHLEELQVRRWVADIHYLVLDCPDELRRRRIGSGPPWRARDTDEQVAFGQWLRASIADSADTSQGTPQDTAAAVAAWVRRR